MFVASPRTDGPLSGALALATGVVVEAVAAHFMVESTVRQILDGEWDTEERDDIRYGEILRFYYPLALTSLIGLSVQPT